MIRTVTMTVIVKVPTVIATAEDMDTELNLMDPQFWESMDLGLSQILCKHRNAVQIEQNLFKAEVAQAAAALFSK